MTIKSNPSAIKSLCEEISEVAAAKAYGVDICMLIDNVNRTPTERIRRHQIALSTADKFRNARKV